MPLQPLANDAVCGMRLQNGYMLRLDQLHGLASGNKYFKLKNNLCDFGATEKVVSFGGAWSNHLHALAAVCEQQGIQSVGIVRGERLQTLSATLRDCEHWGMQLEFVSRSEYRLRHRVEYLAELSAQYAPCRIIPEGGGNEAGVSGCAEIIEVLDRQGLDYGTLAIACGTGTTLAGMARVLKPGRHLLGIPVLKGVDDMPAQIADWTHASNWALEPDFHCGGYARVTEELKQFVLEFEAVQGIPLDPVYTGKLMLALYKLQESGGLTADQPVVAVHSGGLQGRRGFDWLASSYDKGI